MKHQGLRLVTACQVCNASDGRETSICCSSLGAMSLAYCNECALRYAEPKGMIQALIEDLGGLDGIRDDVKDTVTYYEDGKYISMRDYK